MVEWTRLGNFDNLRTRRGTALFVVAHPDDEVVFFFGTIARLRAAGYDVRVACVTGIWDAVSETRVRQQEFWESCHHLGVEAAFLYLRDARGLRLQEDQLVTNVTGLSSSRRPSVVITHNPWGDYGHPHHMQVSAAVHSVFGNRVLCPSGPLRHRVRTLLDGVAYNAKTEHMRRFYASQSFALPWCSQTENLSRVEPTVAVTLARMLSGEEWSTSEPSYRLELRSILTALARCVGDPERHAEGELASIPCRKWVARLAPAVTRCLSLIDALDSWSGRVTSRDE